MQCGASPPAGRRDAGFMRRAATCVRTCLGDEWRICRAPSHRHTQLRICRRGEYPASGAQPRMAMGVGVVLPGLSHKCSHVPTVNGAGCCAAGCCAPAGAARRETPCVLCQLPVTRDRVRVRRWRHSIAPGRRCRDGGVTSRFLAPRQCGTQFLCVSYHRVWPYITNDCVEGRRT